MTNYTLPLRLEREKIWILSHLSSLAHKTTKKITTQQKLLLMIRVTMNLFVTLMKTKRTIDFQTRPSHNTSTNPIPKTVKLTPVTHPVTTSTTSTKSNYL